MAHLSTATQSSTNVRLFLLGGFRAEREGEPVPDDAWQRRHARSLIKVLAIAPGHRLHREQIEDLLWPDAAFESGAGQFRKALHFARHALEPDLAPRQESSYLHLVDELVILDAEQCWIDVDAFQSATTTALAGTDIDQLEHARALYTGELLPEDRYEDWIIARRDGLASQHRSVLLQLAAIYEQRSMHSSAADLLRRLLQEDPAQEEIHRRLMRLAAASGSRHEALKQYQACKTALRDELAAEPGQETEALYREVVAGRAVAETPVATVLPAAVRRQPTTPLVGRKSILDGLRGDFTRATGGNGRAVLLSGEMGVGKSRLMAEFARLGHQAGAVVLWGAAYEQEAQVPYAPLAEALDGYLVGQAAAERARLTEVHQELASLLPTLGRPGDTGQRDLSQDRRPQLFAAIVRFLADIAGDRPLLLVLDDLHAAHDSSVQLFHHLARSASQRRWLVVGAFRYDLAITSGLKRLAIELTQHGFGRHIDLLRLTRQDCGQLLAGMLDGGTVSETLLDEIYTWSLGNALFATVITRELMEHGSVEREGDTWVTPAGSASQVPRQIRELVEARIDRLGSDAQKVLALAATAGSDCSFALLRDATPLGEDTLLDVLDLALATYVVEEQGDGYAFSHPIYRATLYDRLPRRRRASLHAALARAIEERGVELDGEPPASAETLAHHLTEAGEPERAVPWLIVAADHAASVYAGTDAITRLNQALGLIETAMIPPNEATVHRAAIYQRLGDLHALAGNTELAYESCLHALQTDALTPVATAGVHRQAARQALATGDVSRAEEHIADATRLVESVVPEPDVIKERLPLRIVVAQAHFLANRFEESLAVANESAQLARELGSEADLAQALEMASMACLPLGQWRRGLDYEREHEGIVDVNRFVRDVADVHFCFGEYHVYASGPADTARTFIERALDEAERIEAPRSLALCHYYLGLMAFFRGRFRDAMAHQTQAIGFYHQVDSSFGEAIARMVRGVSQTAIGQLDKGRKDMERGMDLAQHGALSSHATIRLYAGLCRNRLDANDAEAARSYAEQGLALATEPSTCICYAAFLPGATAAFAVSGDLDHAAELGGRGLEEAHAFNSPATLCMAQQANAMVYAMTGSWAPAFDALDDARHLAEDHEFPYELARVLLLRSFVHMQRRTPRDLATATGLMAEASPLLVRLGVRASAAQLRSSMGFLRDHAGNLPA